MNIFLSNYTNEFYTAVAKTCLIISYLLKEFFILLNLKLLCKAGIYTTFENMKGITFQENVVVLQNVKTYRRCLVLPVHLTNVMLFTDSNILNQFFLLLLSLLRYIMSSL